MLCELRDEPTVELLQFSVQIRYPEPVIAPKVGQRPILPYAEQVSLRLNRFFHCWRISRSARQDSSYACCWVSQNIRSSSGRRESALISTCSNLSSNPIIKSPPTKTKAPLNCRQTIQRCFSAFISYCAASINTFGIGGRCIDLHRTLLSHKSVC